MDRKTKLILAATASFIVAWSIFLLYMPPQTLVSSLGVKNIYIIAFLIGLIGGFSSFTTTPVIAAIVTFAAGGINPFIIGPAAGLGNVVGDLFFFWFGGKFDLPQSKVKFMKHVRIWFQQHPKLVPLLVFLYISFVPMPNDILMVSLGLVKARLRRLIPIIIVGNMIHYSILAYLGGQGLAALLGL